MKIDAFIFNWRGHESHAAALEQQLGRLTKVTVINSEEQAEAAHPHWVHLGESAYFSAHWNKAVELCSADLMFQIQADASHNDFQSLLAKTAGLFERLPIGVYEPNVDYTFQSYDRRRLSRIEPDIYEVPTTDTICWCVRRDVAESLPPVDTSINKYGWGICAAIAASSRIKKRLCVRDYSVTVRHPRGTGYPTDLAWNELVAYIEALPPNLREEVRFLYRERDRILGATAGKRGSPWKRPIRFLGRIFGGAR